MIFKNRKEAGEKLAEKLKDYKNTNAIVYALPRGGVIVGHEIAQSLNLQLDLFITRKICHEFNPEYAICAVTENGNNICNEDEKIEINQKWLNGRLKEEIKEARRRREVYLKNKPMLSPKNKVAIIVDDGIVTGLTIMLAIREIRKENPSKIIIVVPVIPNGVVDKIMGLVDVIISLKIDKKYVGAVGEYYEDFSQVTDYDVIGIMSNYNKQNKKE